jgi:hypothetical protein
MLGRGVARSFAEARAWYLEAAEQGDAQAQYNLGVIYGKGQGVEIDYVEAGMWLTLAGESGHEGAAALVETLRPLLSDDQLGALDRRVGDWRTRHD